MTDPQPSRLQPTILSPTVLQPIDAGEPVIDIAFSADAQSPLRQEYAGLIRAADPVTPQPWYIRSDAAALPALPASWHPHGTPGEASDEERRQPAPLTAVPALQHLASVDRIEPAAVPTPDPTASSSLATPWFIRVDPPKPSSLVGHARLPDDFENREHVVERAAEAARKRALSVRTRKRVIAASDASADLVLPQTAAALSISVLGCGAASLALASAFALSGHSVIVVTDTDDAMIALESGEEHFTEPALHRLHTSALNSGALRFTVDRRVVSGATIILVLDPGDEDAIAALLPTIGLGTLVVVASPIAAGMRALERRIRPTGAELAWVPLLARDGTVVSDLLSRQGLLFGLPRDPLAAADVRGTLDDVYAFALKVQPADGTPAPVVEVDFATADLARAAGDALLQAAGNAD